MAESKEMTKMLETYFQSTGSSLQRRNTAYHENWQVGCDAYETGDFETALKEFKSMEQSRMLYNVGMVYLAQNQMEYAKDAFTKALSKDRFFALGWFQRGYCDYMLKDLKNAEQDYVMAKKLLHENDSIDYSKLGCKFLLKKTEILYNLALCQLQLGLGEECGKTIAEGKAIAEKEKGIGRIDFDGLRSGKISLLWGEHLPIFAPRELFHPQTTLAKAAQQGKGRNMITSDRDKAPTLVARDALGDVVRAKLRSLPEADQAQIYYTLHSLKKAYGEEISSLKSVPDVAGQEDFILKNILELRDLAYHKNIDKTLARHARELAKSSESRAAKWKLWCDLYAEHTNNHKEDVFHASLVKSGVVHPTLQSAVTSGTSEDEELLLQQLLSFLLLHYIKPDNVAEFLKVLSHCAHNNESIANLVVNVVLNLQDLEKSENSAEVSAIFPSFLLSLEIKESAGHCKQLKTSSILLAELEKVVHARVEDLTKSVAKDERQYTTEKQTHTDELSQMDAEIAEIRQKLTEQALDIQSLSKSLYSKQVQRKVKHEKLEIASKERAAYVARQDDELKSIATEVDVSHKKIETFKKSVKALEVFDRRAQATIRARLDKFVPSLLRLVSLQESNIQFLATKFHNCQTSAAQFQSEIDIIEKLQVAFAGYARHFATLVHNTHLLGQSAEVITAALDQTKHVSWDASEKGDLAKVEAAAGRIAELDRREEQLENQFAITRGGIAD